MTARCYVVTFFVAVVAFSFTGCGALGPSSNHPISVAFTNGYQPPASMKTSTTVPIAATVSNDAKNLGVRWTVACGSPSCGSVSPEQTASSVPTQFTAPANVPAGGVVTVTALSVADNTKIASATIEITQVLPISVAIKPAAPASMNTTSTATLTAVVTNDPHNAGVNWSVTCGGGQCGSFSPSNPIASGSAVTYHAPSFAPTGGVVTVVATSVSDNSKFASANITIVQLPVSVVIDPLQSARVDVNSTTAVTAIVSNDPNNAGVNWSVACGGSSCGSFTTTNPVSSGTAALFQAPITVPAGNTVALTATSVTDSTKSASISLTVSIPALGNGTYIYHLSGVDFSTGNGESTYNAVGALSIGNGVITGGEQDLADGYNTLHDQINPATSSLSTTADGNWQIVLDTGDQNIGVGGIETIDASLVSGSRALIGEYDAFASSTGTLDLQTTQIAPMGGYAFGVSGIDSSSSPLAVGGILNIDGPGSISGTGSVFDLNDSFSLGVFSDQTFIRSTVLGAGQSVTPDSFGRVTFTLNPSNSQIGQIALAGYIVNSTLIQLVELADVNGSRTGGSAFGQGNNRGGFTNSTLSNATYVVGANGSDQSGAHQVAGMLGFGTPINGVTGSLTLSDIGISVSGAISNGAYALDPTGRLTVSNVSGNNFNNLAFEFYLDGNGNAAVLSMDSTDVTAGFAFQQSVSAPTLNGLYSLDAYGTGTLPSNLNAGVRPRVNPRPERGGRTLVQWSALGQAVADTTTGISGFADVNIANSALTADVALSGTATGSGDLLTDQLTGLFLGSDTATTFDYFVIDNNRAFGIEADGWQNSLVYFEQAH